MGVGRVGAERVQRFEALSLVVSATRSLAVDGDEDVAAGPQRANPVFETACECLRIDPVHQRAQPALAGDAIVIGREFSQEIEMVMAKRGDLVEVVARGDGGAGQQQQDLGQRVDDPPRLTVVFEPGKMLQQQCYARPRHVLVGEKVGCLAHSASPKRFGAPKESHLRVKPKSSLT